jgi:hypothetical protein
VPTKPRKADDPPPNLSLQTGKLFTNVPGKPYARRLTINLNVIVEFVPDFADSSPLESSAYGNANAVVLKVADRLNAQVLSTFDNPPGSFESPAVNVAFHSDEGGRPYTKDIGFPVALFLPDHLVNTGGGPKQTQARPVAQLIATNAAFLAAIMDLKANCLVPIQAAWLASLMLAAQAPDNEKLAAPLRSLILGPLPPNKYTDLQEAAYQELYDAFLKIMGPLTEKGVFSKSLGTAEVVRNQVIPLFDALNVDGKVDLDAVEAMLAGMGTE